MTDSQNKAYLIWLRVLLFLVFPSCMGTMGLLVAYVFNKTKAGSGDEEENPVNFDRDFMYPFTVTLATVSLIYYQSNGFSTSEARPLIAWPKVKRRRKIVRKTVVVEDDLNDGKKNTSGRRKGSRKED